MLSVILYCLLTLVGCVVLAVPGVTFAVLAGILFGPWLGTLLCLVATGVGAAIAFLIGRFFLKEALEPALSKNLLLRQLLFDSSHQKDILVLMITRLLPIFPYNLQNFAYGITDMPFWRYTIWSFIFLLPGVAMFTIGSAGLTDPKNRVFYFTIALILAIIVIGSAIYIQRRFLTKPKEKKSTK